MSFWIGFWGMKLSAAAIVRLDDGDLMVSERIIETCFFLALAILHAFGNFRLDC